MNDQPEFPHALLQVSNVIGTLIDSSGEKLGDVKDVVINPNGGGFAYAVVAFRGFLGMGEKLFAVPFGALRYVRHSNEYTLSIGRDRLKGSLCFDAGRWSTKTDEQWNMDINRHDGDTSYRE